MNLTARLDAAFSRRLLVARFDRAFYRRIGQPERYEAGGRWITVGAQSGDDGRKGGTPVFIDAKGRIVKGPKSLKGRSIKRLSGQSQSAKRNQAVADVARQHGVDRKELEAAAGDVWREKRELADRRERAKKIAREFTGLTEADIARIENQHLDWSTVPGFDQVSRELANTFPELGLSREDPADDLWAMLREGAKPLPTRHDPEIVEEAAERLQVSGPTSRPDATEDPDDRFSRIGAAFDRAFYGRLRAGFPS